MSYNNCDKRVGNSFCNQPKGHGGQCALVNIPFQNFMDEYAHKQGVNPNTQAQEVINLDDMGIARQDSCGSGASEGKASEGVIARVEGLGAGTVGADNSAKTAVNHAQSSGSESQQNCAGLGAEWGIPPAGMNKEALMLAQNCVLLSRSLAYVGLSSDLNCARQLAVEIRDQLDAINAYALSRGIGMDLADALLKLMGANGELVGFTPSNATA